MFFASNLKKPRRFDFICYRATTPERGAVIFTHRLSGLPGDLIEIRAGILFVNNQEADSKLALMHVYKVDIKDTATLVYDESLGVGAFQESGLGAHCAFSRCGGQWQ